ncbi:hypothetical protein D1BOALGB6SA_5964 [Olavius sp. associated proteobacterium Delta 1]|nr:hypothetical protein D1BOALGB6SA_5964 [Olavius sp. associated proteobacterium Delta 1]
MPTITKADALYKDFERLPEDEKYSFALKIQCWNPIKKHKEGEEPAEINPQ